MNKRVFVSGGSSVLGNAIVSAFSGANYKVAFQYSDNADGAKELSDRTGAKAFRLNFLDNWDCPSIEADVFVHNAGINLSGRTFDTMSDQELSDTMNVNVLAASRLSRHFLPLMKSKSWGRIICINSIYGFRAGKYRLSYNVSKFGLSALTQSLAIELAEYGITVNQICPGPVRTAMLLKMAELAVTQSRYSDTSAYLSAVSTSVPIGRLISPHEIAATAMFLASEAAAACTGTSIVVDGGMSLRWV